MIDDEIKFIGVRDFYIRCDRIRRHYLLLNRQEKNYISIMCMLKDIYESIVAISFGNF